MLMSESDIDSTNIEIDSATIKAKAKCSICVFILFSIFYTILLNNTSI